MEYEYSVTEIADTIKILLEVLFSLFTQAFCVSEALAEALSVSDLLPVVSHNTLIHTAKSTLFYSSSWTELYFHT